MEKEKIVALLNADIGGEHAAIIQYLAHAYGMGEGEMSCEIEAITRDEMQPLGWLAEKMVSDGGSPRIEHTEYDRSTRTADMLRADIKIESLVAAEYDRAARETSVPDLKKLLVRIRDNEIYHAAVFKNLLADENTQ